MITRAGVRRFGPAGRAVEAFRRVLAACATVLLLSSCASYYDITLSNGDVIRSKGKPKLDEQGFYRFKDLAGREATVNPMRVRQIEPTRRGSPPSPPF
jgi:hypothetical protein